MYEPKRIHCDRHSSVAVEGDRAHDPLEHMTFCFECLWDELKTKYDGATLQDGRPLNVGDVATIMIGEGRPKAVGMAAPVVGTGS